MVTFNIPITIHVIKGSGCATATVQGSSTYSTNILATGISYKITGSASTTATLASTSSVSSISEEEATTFSLKPSAND